MFTVCKLLQHRCHFIMAKGNNNKQRKRVAKTLSKAFRKLEVGQQPSQQVQSSKQAPQTNRMRKRQGFKQRKQAKDNSEKIEFDREQASLNERNCRRDRRNNTSTIELQPATFSLRATEDTIQQGIAALEGFGNDSYITYNQMGEATTSFLFQQAQKSVAESAATAKTNRFAALLQFEDDNHDDSAENYSTPTSHGATIPAIQFPPPLFQVSRPKIKDIHEAPLFSSLDADL